jgi:hypothetical protein
MFLLQGFMARIETNELNSQVACSPLRLSSDGYTHGCPQRIPVRYRVLVVKNLPDEHTRENDPTDPLGVIRPPFRPADQTAVPI